MKRTRIRANLTCLLALTSVALLSSCGKSLNRSGAMSLLESIAAHASSSDFSAPESYSVEESSKGVFLYNGYSFKEGSLSQGVNFSFTDSYYHLSVTVEGKIGPATTMAYTSESWVYVDITQPSGATLYYLVEASLDDLAEDANKRTYKMTNCATLEEAQKAFLAQSAVAKEAKRRDCLYETPRAFSALLGSFDNYNVSKEDYSTTDEYDFEASVAYQAKPTATSMSTSASVIPTESEKIKIKNTLLLSVVTSDGTTDSTTAYSWNGYKPSKPDLANYTRTSSSI